MDSIDENIYLIAEVEYNNRLSFFYAKENAKTPDIFTVYHSQFHYRRIVFHPFHLNKRFLPLTLIFSGPEIFVLPKHHIKQN